jgi:hypothetical protein
MKSPAEYSARRRVRRDVQKRRLILAAAAICLTVALSGCLVFKVRPSATAAPLGPVTISTTICASDAQSPFIGGCRNGDVFTGDANGNSNSDAIEGFLIQMLLGYRVPAGADGPAGFAAGRLTFTTSPSYAAELERLAPAGPGMQWVGYISNSFDFDAQQTRETKADVPFGLPRSADGSPFQGPFRYRPVVGARLGTDPAIPVDCGNDLFIEDNNNLCVDAPAPGTGPDQFGSNLSVPTSDLAITGGGDVTAAPGSSATASFSARYVGDLQANFAISASTGVPAATATPSLGSLAPAADSTNPLQVTVNVPPGTAPGRYPVTLTARLDAQRTRTATATIVVPAPAPPPQPPLRITSPVEVSWKVRGRLTRVVRLRVRDVPSGATVRAKCSGRPCPFRSRRFKGARVNIGKAFKKRLRAGARIEVRITAPGAIGKVVRYKTRRGKLPKTTRLCVPLGAQRARKTC